SFDEKSGNQIIVKVATSSASIDGALKTLNADVNGFDFNKVSAKADAAWNHELSKFSVETPDKDQKTIFYTALYHSFIAPSTYSDIQGEYKGYNNTTKKAVGYTKYTILSLWDTFRALNPLLTISNPTMVNDLVKSMLDQYEETGLLPVWELTGNETNCMIGYHAIPVITDAILKGIGDFDRETAYKAMIASSMSDQRGLKYYREIGYIPADKETESASKVLEYCYDDYCIAQVAKFLGKENDYQTYMKRSQNYRNQFDTSVGFMRGRNSDGSWVTPFDPAYSKHETGVFTEGNAWQWTWFVPHDILGLANLMGGKEKMISKLDQLFLESSVIKGENSSPDISGLIGQYAHGNEPFHHVIYMFNALGAPWKTQEKADMVMKTLYTSKPDGLCGNDDCGQMSAWYAFNAMGLYPANAVSGRYELGSPRFTKTEIKLANGKVFRIMAPGVSKTNIYIQSAMLNGKPLSRTFITHKELLAGGELKLVMGAKPVK
ncbi:MAG: glycoside hydrolase family 92 protein, partial [Bacteroidota bacterium]|nr:glycoside hydrolase family 92 protein [Bacteroidota bacterium]